MYGARFADKPRAEHLEDLVSGNEDSPKLLYSGRVIRRMRAVLVERNRIDDLDRHLPDGDLNPERFQYCHELCVEIRNRPRREGQLPILAIAGPQLQLVLDEVKLSFKRPLPVGNE